MAKQFKQCWYRPVVADNQDDIIAIFGSNALKMHGIVSGRNIDELYLQRNSKGFRCLDRPLELAGIDRSDTGVFQQAGQ